MSKPMKQGRLGFTSAKRTTSANAKKPAKTPISSVNNLETAEPVNRSEADNSTNSDSSEDELEVQIREKKPLPKRKVVSHRLAVEAEPRDVSETSIEGREDILSSMIDSGKLRKIYRDAREKMGHSDPSECSSCSCRRTRCAYSVASIF
jgi:hypothetical protein